MSWYYASAEAKPVGPVSEVQLHALHAAGTILSETYIIEHTDQPPENWAWRRYREAFPPPAAPVLPPSPAAYVPPPVPPVGVPAEPPPSPAAHALFPSAGAVSPLPPPVPPVAPPAMVSSQPGAVFAAPRPTNRWCGWGFGIGLGSLFLAFACVGIFPAILAIILCVVGFIQVQQNRGQSGRGLAVAGLVCSLIAVVISLSIMTLLVPMMKGHYEWTVTEQTTNDSE